MNRFKHVIPQGRSDDYSKRKQEVQLLTILDKCTQVLRDDRIWIRNKVKEGDIDILQIFKKYLSKRPSDLSSLQVNLRKHIMKIKDKSKKQQLQKFKENLNSVAQNTLFDRQNASYQRSSKSMQMRKPKQPEVYFEDDEQLSQEKYIYKNQSKPKYQPKRFDQHNLKKSPLPKTKIPDSFEEEQNEKGFSCRSIHNRNKSSHQSSEKPTPEHKSVFPWQKPVNNYLKKQKQLSINVEEEHQQNPMHSVSGQFARKQQEPVLRQKLYIPEQLYQIEQSNIESNDLNSQVHSIGASNFRNSMTYYANEISETFSHEYKAEVNFNNYQPPSFSVIPAEEEKHVHFCDNPSGTFLPYSNRNSKEDFTKDDEANNNLFTNPELLMECRRFLNSSRVKNQQVHHELGDSNPCSFEPTPNTSVINPNANSLALRAKDCNSETKVIPTNNSISAQKPQNPLSHLAVVESFQKDNEASQLIPDISKLYAEDVFDIIFPTNNPMIDISRYENIVNHTFAEKNKLMKLFKLGDKAMNNTLMATDFGRLLLTNCNYKPSPNPVKQIFSLIDIDRKGFFTLDDYERFLEQVIDPDDAEANQIISTCENLFQQADIGRTERVQYWGLYLTRKSQQFEDFNAFLEQFQFEFEVV